MGWRATLFSAIFLKMRKEQLPHDSPYNDKISATRPSVSLLYKLMKREGSIVEEVEQGLQNPLNAGPLLPPMFSDPQRQGYLLGDTHTTTSPRAQHQAASPSVKFLAATKDIEAYEEISVEEVSASPSACLPV